MQCSKLVSLNEFTGYSSDLISVNITLSSLPRDMLLVPAFPDSANGTQTQGINWWHLLISKGSTSQSLVRNFAFCGLGTAQCGIQMCDLALCSCEVFTMKTHLYSQNFLELTWCAQLHSPLGLVGESGANEHKFLNQAKCIVQNSLLFACKREILALISFLYLLTYHHVICSPDYSQRPSIKKITNNTPCPQTPPIA